MIYIGYGGVMVDGKLNRLTLLSDFFSLFVLCCVIYIGYGGVMVDGKTG